VADIISVGFHLEWECPIVVRADAVQDRFIQSPKEALKFLQTNFTIRDGTTYRAAVSACNAALLNRVGVEEARDYFLAAYIEYLERLYE
jgi:hypothetical protein